MFLFPREDAHVALEEVREIQYNLGEAERLQAEISTQREEIDMYNRTYWAAIQKVFSVCYTPVTPEARCHYGFWYFS